MRYLLFLPKLQVAQLNKLIHAFRELGIVASSHGMNDVLSLLVAFLLGPRTV